MTGSGSVRKTGLKARGEVTLMAGIKSQLDRGSAGRCGGQNWVRRERLKWEELLLLLLVDDGRGERVRCAAPQNWVPMGEPEQRRLAAAGERVS